MNNPLDADTLRAIKDFGDLLNNTGGNPPAELLEDFQNNERLFATNIVRYLLATAVDSQVNLILRLQKEGLLRTKEQAKRDADYSWVANPDRMGR